MTDRKVNIKTLSLETLGDRLEELGLKRYRSRQIFDWVYGKLAATFEEMTNIAKQERALLASAFSVPDIVLLARERSADGTCKFLFKLEDGHCIESVLIPDQRRVTLCISSQVGCKQGCRFCLTGKSGLQRNLRSFEIVDQVIAAARNVRDEEAGRITNIVLMGMGEPLDNFQEVVAALRLMTSEQGLGISPRRITLSTSGLAPRIGELGASGTKVNLAVSLNASEDGTRDRIMPVNKRWPIKDLLAACKRYPLEPRRRITFEYVLLKGVNDSEADALRVAHILRGIRCKINLIPFNPFPGSEFERPDEEAVRRFQAVLLTHRYTAPVRESRGQDISAACGQLRERGKSASPS